MILLFIKCNIISIKHNLVFINQFLQSFIYFNYGMLIYLHVGSIGLTKDPGIFILAATLLKINVTG